MKRSGQVASFGLLVLLLGCNKDIVNRVQPDGYIVQVTLVDNFNKQLITGMEVVIDSAPGGPSLGFTASPPTPDQPLAGTDVLISTEAKNVDTDPDIEFVITFKGDPFKTNGFQFFLASPGFNTAPFSVRVNLLSTRGLLATGVATQLPTGDPILFAPNVRGFLTVAIPCQPGISCTGMQNRDPVMATITDGTLNIRYDRTLKLVLDAYDPDGDPLTFSANSTDLAKLPGSPTFDAATRTFTWTPPAQAVADAPYVVNFEVRDDKGGRDSKPASIRVVADNSSPIIQPIGSKLVAEGQLLVVQLDVSDPDGDAVTVTLDKSQLPAGNDAALDNRRLVLTWTPSFQDGRANQPYPVTLTARDPAGAETSASFGIWVTDVNRAPVITAPDEVTVKAGTQSRLVIAATDPDSDPLTVTFDASELPAGNNASFDSTTLTLTWTPAAADVQATPWKAKFTASDGKGGTFTKSVLYVVSNDNSGPVFTPVMPPTATVGTPISFAVKASDPDGEAVTITMDASGLPSGNNATFVGGTFTWTPVASMARDAPYRVTFTAKDATGLTTALDVLITVQPARGMGIPTALSFSVAPSGGAAGSPIVPAVQVKILDALNQVVTSATNAVTVALGTNPAGGVLSGTLTATPVGGVAVFNDLRIDKAGSGYTLQATAGGLVSATSPAFTVSAGPAAALVVTGIPSPVAAGAPSVVTVTAVDGAGNIATDYAGTVAITSTDAQAVLPPSFSFLPADKGTHSFPVILKSAGSQSVIATDTAVGSITGSQAEISVTPGAAATLQVSGITTPVVAGTSATVTVTAIDAFGNLATGYQGTIGFTSTDARAVLPPDYTFLAGDSGTHTFAGAVVLSSAGTWSVTATDKATTTIAGSQSGIAVTPAAAHTLLVTGIPNPVTAGAPASLTVTAVDSFGNVATGYSGTVQFSSDDPHAVLPSSYTFVAADNGAHLFAGVQLRTAGSFNVTATDSVTASVSGTQAGITVNPAGAATLQVTGIPATVEAGALETAVVTAVDAFGNVVTGYSGTVSFSSSDTKATLPSSYSFLPADTGVHAFDITLRTAGTQSISIADTVFPSISGAQNGIAVTASAASLLLVSGIPSQVTAGAASSMTVEARDDFGNRATSYAGTVHADSTSTQKTLPGDYSFTTGVGGDNGIHVFDGVVLSTAGTQTITVADLAAPSLSGEESGIVVMPGSAAAFGVSGIASPVTAGATSSVVVEAFDAFGNRATAYTGTVKFSSTSTQRTLPADYAFTTGSGAGADNGIHSFNGVVLGTAGIQSVTATDAASPGVTGAETGIQIDPGAAASLELTGIPGAMTAGTAVSPTVEARDTFGNRATSYAGTVHFATSSSNKVLPGDHTFTVGTGNDNGIHTFAGAVDLRSPGTQSVTVSDTVAGSLQATVSGISVSAGPVSLSNSTATANPTSGVVSNGTSTSVITITILDAYSNPISSVPTQISASGTGNTLTQPGQTNGSGVSTGSIASTVASTKTITVAVDASFGGGTLTAQPTVTFVGDLNPPTFGGIVSAKSVQAATTTLRLSWNAASDDSTPPSGIFYDICSSATSGSCATSFVVSDTVQGVTSFDKGSLASDTRYYFVVRARDQYGNEDSNVVEASGKTSGTKSAVSVVVGQSHTCVLQSDGTIRCYGDNTFGQLGDGTNSFGTTPVQVVGTRLAIAVGAGIQHSCALYADSSVSCWGGNGSGQLGDDNAPNNSNTPVQALGSGSAIAIAVAANQSCAVLKDGTVRCWGSNNTGQLGDGTQNDRHTPYPASLSSATSICTGSGHSCARLGDGTAKCWGSNSAGQVGNASGVSPQLTPVTVSNLANAVAVACYNAHTCAIVSDGTVRCWGRDTFGQIGDDATLADKNSAVPVAAVGSAVAIAGGGNNVNHSCALLSNGGVKCWGLNSSGQLGLGQTSPSQTPLATSIAFANPYVSITEGASRTCGIRPNGTVECWGDVSVASPASQSGLVGVASGTSVVSGIGITCALSPDGIPKCWGSNYNGQVGDGTTATSRPTPVSVTGLSDVVSLTPGYGYRRCAILIDGTAKCWGDNFTGALGMGSTTPSSTNVPTAVTQLSNATQISTGQDHCCARLGDGTGRCWGRGNSGQLGNNSTTFANPAPVQVSNLSNATAVLAGRNHSCALISDGTVKCWGTNGIGQIGDGSGSQQNTAVNVAGMSQAVALTVGSDHSCALISNGTIKCWGDCTLLQCGDGLPAGTRTTPVLVTGINNAVAVGVGSYHSCAVLADGTARCWGYNYSGQVGDGTSGAGTNRGSPVAVSGVTNAVAVAGGSAHTCALLGDGTIRCWGDNSSGDFGDGTTGSSTTSVPAKLYP
jgi:alpha-tubulin suppressor-like RCC1 family protein